MRLDEENENERWATAKRNLTELQKERGDEGEKYEKRSRTVNDQNDVCDIQVEVANLEWPQFVQ